MDRNEFAARVVAQTDRMYRIAYVLLRDPEDCRDAMQEAALRAWEKRRSLREERYFATWLTRILINECRSIQRRRRPRVALEELPEPSAPPHDPALSIALASLPEKLRLPLTMYAVEGMTYEEVAQALRLPRSTIVGRIQRARNELKKSL
ncbi:MAG: RNA polymerase sigma factor [Clostridia bacterium]|nr:RNA polymerase sigma factor [Clostridia bacterium]